MVEMVELNREVWQKDGHMSLLRGERKERLCEKRSILDLQCSTQQSVMVTIVGG